MNSGLSRFSALQLLVFKARSYEYNAYITDKSVSQKSWKDVTSVEKAIVYLKEKGLRLCVAGAVQ